MNVVGGQRSNSRARSYRIVSALACELDGCLTVRNKPLDVPCDLYVQWGYRRTPALQSAVDYGVPFCIVDGGFFEDRDEHISLSFNGFQNLATEIEMPKHDRPHPEPQPWRAPGDLICVYGQVPTDRSLRGLDHAAWVESICDKLEREYPDKTVGFRPHPKATKPPLQLPPMDAAYDRLHLAVTYTSTAAVQTLVAGIPTVALHPASTSWPVASHQPYSRLRMPGRLHWLKGLSHRQYGDHEIAEAATYIRHAFPQARAAADNRAYDLEGIAP